MIRRKWGICLLILTFCLPLLQGCGTSGQQKISKSGFYFDTIITISLYGTSDESYIDSCFTLAGEYENKFSNTIATSEISQINNAGGAAVTVSDETIELLSAGIEYGQISDGLFDITIGDLSDLWNFSEIAENLVSEDNEADVSVLPADEDIQSALSHVDYRNIQIKGNEVRLLDAESKIDVGGIAKGYIADKMRAYLNDAGITCGVISLGGNVLTLGTKTTGEDYTIGIQKPFAQTGTPLGTIKVYERYYRVDGKLYHHILDTTTGYPIENNLYQVTIISEKSMDGDALSTTCFALGLRDGMKLVESMDGIEAIFVTDDGNVHMSSGVGDDGDIQFFSE
jgi:thiamine biosynthesis lipoprotein